MGAVEVVLVGALVDVIVVMGGAEDGAVVVDEAGEEDGAELVDIIVVVDGVAEFEEDGVLLGVTINVVVSGTEVVENDGVLVRTDVVDDVVVEIEDEVDCTIEVD